MTMLSPSFNFKARDHLRHESSGVIVMEKSLSEVVGNLLGILALSTIELLKVFKIIK
jgi:hypothetical protein